MISALLKPSIVINGKKYKIMKQIGEGGFAFVYDVLGTGKESGEHFALKKMICQTDEQLDEAKKEIDTMLALKNPHVLELLDHAYSLNKKNQKEALLLLPLYQGSVQTIIDKGHGFPHCGFADGTDVLKILRQIIEGLKAIHAAGLRHADLKPANILLTDDHHAVITDFGSVSPSPVTIRTRAEALSAQDKASSCTTASYRAPELFNAPSECVLGGESDVWSLGCLIYCMFYSRTPFESAAEGLSTLSVIAAHYQVPESNLWPAEYLEVVAACLRAEPSEREGLDALQARLQSIPCPPLDTRPSLPPLAPPHGANNTHSNSSSANNTAHANSAHTAVSKADATARLNSSTSTTSSAVSTSHLEFSETNSFPTTPVTPSMAVNFADFPDSAAASAGAGVRSGAVSTVDDEVYVHLSDGASVEFASGTALSEICFEEPTGTSVYGSSVGERQGSSSDSVHNSSVVGNSAYANSIAGSVYGSAYASSIADSYVHAGDALSNCSSGQHSPFEPVSSHDSASGVMIVNLPVVPVRKGLSTPNTHYSHDSFEYVEGSVGNSSPHTLRTASDDASDNNNFASFPAFPSVTTTPNTNTTNNTSANHTNMPPAAQRATSIGIAEQAARDEVEWGAEDHEGGGEEEEVFESDDEEFGEFTASTNTTSTTAANISTPAINSTNNDTSTTHPTTTNNNTAQQGGNRDSNSHLQEVDLWRLITAQADAALSNSAHSTTSSTAGTAGGRRHVIKEGAVYMMRQGGFPKRWAKKQVWLVLTPLGLILRKDSSPESRIHEVLSLHRPLHCNPSDTLPVGLNGVRVEGSAPVVLSAGGSGGSGGGAGGSGKRERRDEGGDWVKVSVTGDVAGTSSTTGTSGTTGTANTTDSGTSDTSSTTNHSSHPNTTAYTTTNGKCLFVHASFEISFEDKDVMNEWLDAVEEQRDMFLA